MDVTVGHWSDRRTNAANLQLADIVYRSYHRGCAAMRVDDIGSTSLDAYGGILPSLVHAQHTGMLARLHGLFLPRM